VSDKRYIEHQNAHFIFNNFLFSEIVPFMRYVENMVRPARPQMKIHSVPEKE